MNPTGSASWIAAVAAAVLVIGMLAMQPWRMTASKVGARVAAQRAADGALCAAPENSIAVLPFADLSEKKDQEYFSDGLSEELIDRLSRIADLSVSARTSSFYFKGRSENIATIAQKLRVTNVLEGSVHRSGNRIRITAQLIHGLDGRRLWTEAYDRGLQDVFKVQDEIAAAVAAALKLTPGPHLGGSRVTADMDAYDQYLIGRHFQRREKIDGWRLSVDPLRKAIALESGYGAAYAALAYSEVNLADAGQDAAGLQRAVADADKAVTLAPDLAEGYATRGLIRTYYTWDWAGGQGDLEKALALDPGNSAAQSTHAALLATLGRLPDAIGAAKKSAELDPLSISAWERLGEYLTANGQYAAADAAIRRALALQADNPYALTDLGTLRLVESNAPDALAAFHRIDRGGYNLTGIAMAQYSLGRTNASEQALAEAIAKHASGTAYQIAQAYAWRGEKDPAFDWLERAYRRRDAGLCFLKFDPLLDSIRRDVRYGALLRELKLPE